MSDVASMARWWHEMGVDTLIDEDPVPWLDRGTPGLRKVEAEPAAPQPAALPATLLGLQQWLATGADIPGGAPQRLAWSGTPGSTLMIMIDMPLAGDVEADALLS